MAYMGPHSAPAGRLLHSSSIDSPATSSSSSSSRLAMTSRRSLAHTPRLLGLGEDGLIHMQGLSSAAAESFQSGPGTSASILARTPLDEESGLDESEDHRFRIDEEDEIETVAEESQQSSVAKAARQSGDGRTKSGTMLAPIRIDSYAPLEGYQVEQGEDSAMIGREQEHVQPGVDTMDLERNGTAKYSPNGYAGLGQAEDGGEADFDVDGDETARLYFEPTSAREKLLMWTSVGLVVALTLVSIAIAVNWIDWPGDGIGKDSDRA